MPPTLPLLALLACSSPGADRGSALATLGLSPQTGGQGTTLTLDLDASVAAFGRDRTTLSLGEGISVDQLDVDDGWSARALVTIADDAELGARDATITIDGQQTVLNDAFAVIAESFGISPDSALIGETVTVAFTGRSTAWTSGVTWPSFGHGIEVTDFTVTDPTTAVGTVVVASDAPPGRHDVEIQDGAGARLVLPDGFLVDRAAVAGELSPAGAMQGETLSFRIEARGTDFVSDQTTVTFLDEGGAANDIIVDSVTVVSATSLVGQLTVSNAAVIGTRDVNVIAAGQGVYIPDAFSVLAGPFSLEDVAVDLRFYVDRDLDNATGAVDQRVTAYAMFYTPLDPECPLPSGIASGELGSPDRYDLPEAFGIQGTGESDEDCPNELTYRAGEVVWLESPSNVITLDLVEDDASGVVYYIARDLPLADYVLDNLYDLHTQGDPDQISEERIEGIQPTVPADWELLSPDLWGNHSHDRARPLCFTWTPAQTYPDASFITSIWSRSSPGPLIEEGWVGYAGAVPWDDGDFCYEAAQLSVLAPGTVPLSFYSYEAGPEFGLPGSIYQDNQASTWIRLRASMVLE